LYEVHEKPAVFRRFFYARLTPLNAGGVEIGSYSTR
jgi:hypothetical protein